MSSLERRVDKLEETIGDCRACAGAVQIELAYPGREPGKPKTCGHCGAQRRTIMVLLAFDPKTVVSGPDKPRRATVVARAELS